MKGTDSENRTPFWGFRVKKGGGAYSENLFTVIVLKATTVAELTRKLAALAENTNHTRSFHNTANNMSVSHSNSTH